MYAIKIHSFIHSFIHSRPQGHMQLCNFKGLAFYLTKTPIGFWFGVVMGLDHSYILKGEWVPFVNMYRPHGTICIFEGSSL